MNSSEKPWIGFDLGGTKMLALVLNNEYKIIARERKKTKPKDNSELKVDRIISTIRSALTSAGMSDTKLSGIGIGVPGALDLKSGTILNAPNLGWVNVPIKQLLENEFSCPVVIANDADSGVYGEYFFGAGLKSNSVLGVFCGTGIGGGFIINGDIYTSETTSCLEIGHMPAVANGTLCGCGRNGCLETVASRLAIAAAAAVAVYRGDAPNLHKLINNSDISDIRSGILAQAIAEGDKKIEQIVRNAAMYVGIVLSGVINLLAPEIIVLGGGLVQAMPDLYLEEVEKTVSQHVLPSFKKIYKILTAKLEDDATALGAAAWARKLTSAT